MATIENKITFKNKTATTGEIKQPITVVPAPPATNPPTITDPITVKDASGNVMFVVSPPAPGAGVQPCTLTIVNPALFLDADDLKKKETNPALVPASLGATNNAFTISAKDAIKLATKQRNGVDTVGQEIEISIRGGSNDKLVANANSITLTTGGKTYVNNAANGTSFSMEFSERAIRDWLSGSHHFEQAGDINKNFPLPLLGLFVQENFATTRRPVRIGNFTICTLPNLTGAHPHIFVNDGVSSFFYTNGAINKCKDFVPVIDAQGPYFAIHAGTGYYRVDTDAAHANGMHTILSGTLGIKQEQSNISTPTPLTAGATFGFYPDDGTLKKSASFKVKPANFNVSDGTGKTGNTTTNGGTTITNITNIYVNNTTVNENITVNQQITNVTNLIQNCIDTKTINIIDMSSGVINNVTNNNNTTINNVVETSLITINQEFNSINVLLEEIAQDETKAEVNVTNIEQHITNINQQIQILQNENVSNTLIEQIKNTLVSIENKVNDIKVDIQKKQEAKKPDNAVTNNFNIDNFNKLTLMQMLTEYNNFFLNITAQENGQPKYPVNSFAQIKIEEILKAIALQQKNLKALYVQLGKYNETPSEQIKEEIVKLIRELRINQQILKELKDELKAFAIFDDPDKNKDDKIKKQIDDMSDAIDKKTDKVLEKAEDMQKEKEEEPQEIKHDHKKQVEYLTKALFPLSAVFIALACLTPLGMFALIPGIAFMATCVIANAYSDKFVYSTWDNAHKYLTKQEKQELEDQEQLDKFMEKQAELEKFEEKIEQLAYGGEVEIVDANGNTQKVFQPGLQQSFEDPALAPIMNAYNQYGIGFNATPNPNGLDRSNQLLGQDGHEIRKGMHKQLAIIVDPNATPAARKAAANKFIDENFGPELPDDKRKEVFDLLMSNDPKDKKAVEDMITRMGYLNAEEDAYLALLSESKVDIAKMPDYLIARALGAPELDVGNRRARFIDRYGPTLVRRYAINDGLSQAKLNMLFSKVPEPARDKCIQQMQKIAESVLGSVESLENFSEESAKKHAAIQTGRVLGQHIQALYADDTPIATQEDVHRELENYYILQSYRNAHTRAENTFQKLEGLKINPNNTTKSFTTDIAEMLQAKTNLSKNHEKAISLALELGFIQKSDLPKVNEGDDVEKAYEPVYARIISQIAKKEKQVSYQKPEKKAKINELKAAMGLKPNETEKVFNNYKKVFTLAKKLGIIDEQILNHIALKTPVDDKKMPEEQNLLNVIFKFVKDHENDPKYKNDNDFIDLKNTISPLQRETSKKKIQEDAMHELARKFGYTQTRDYEAEKQFCQDWIKNQVPGAERDNLQAMFDMIVSGEISDMALARVEELALAEVMGIDTTKNIDNEITQATSRSNNAMTGAANLDRILADFPAQDREGIRKRMVEIHAEDIKKDSNADIRLALIDALKEQYGKIVVDHTKGTTLGELLDSCITIENTSQLVNGKKESAKIYHVDSFRLEQLLDRLEAELTAKEERELSCCESQLGKQFTHDIYSMIREGDKFDAVENANLTPAQVNKEQDAQKKLLFAVDIQAKFESAWRKARDKNNPDFSELEALIAEPKHAKPGSPERQKYDNTIKLLESWGVNVAEIKKLIKNSKNRTMTKEDVATAFENKEQLYGFELTSKEAVATQLKKFEELKMMHRAVDQHDKDTIQAMSKLETAVDEATSVSAKLRVFHMLKSSGKLSESEFRLSIVHFAKGEFDKIASPHLRGYRFSQKDPSILAKIGITPENVADLTLDEITEKVKKYIEEQSADYKRLAETSSGKKERGKEKPDGSTQKTNPKRMKNKISLIARIFGHIREGDKLSRERQAELERLGLDKTVTYELEAAAGEGTLDPTEHEVVSNP